jgi:integrase/recombinase XerD
MTKLREKMIEDLQLRGLSSKTQELYVRAVQHVAEHYRKSPDKITEDELREYFLYLVQIRDVSPSTLRVALCGIKFFYQHTLQREWITFDLIRPRKRKKLPVVLTIDEVCQILSLVRRLQNKICLSTSRDGLPTVVGNLPDSLLKKNAQISW